MVNNNADTGRSQGCTQCVTEQAGEARSGTRNVRGGQVNSLQTNQHDRAVNQATNQSQRNVRNPQRRIRRRQPVQQNRADGRNQEQDTRGGAATLEHAVRNVTAQHGATNAGKLQNREARNTALKGGVAHIVQVLRRPHQHTVTQGVHEHVCQSQVHHGRVGQHVLTDGGPSGLRTILSGGLNLVRVVAVHVNGGQTLSLGVVTNQQPCDERQNEADNSREPEGNFPGLAEQGEAPGHQQAGQRTTNVVGGVPPRNLSTALAGGEPVHEHTARGRPTHTLEDTVEDHDGRHDGGDSGTVACRTRAFTHVAGQRQQDVCNTREHQTDGQEQTRVRAVRNHCGEELAEAVSQQQCRGQSTNCCVAEAKFLGQNRGDQRDVVTNQVEGRVTDENTHEDLQAHAWVLRINFCFAELGLGCRNSEPAGCRTLLLL